MAALSGGGPGLGIGAEPGIVASDPETPIPGSLCHTVDRKEGTQWPGAGTQDQHQWWPQDKDPTGAYWKA